MSLFKADCIIHHKPNATIMHVISYVHIVTSTHQHIKMREKLDKTIYIYTHKTGVFRMPYWHMSTTEMAGTGR